MSGEKSVVIFFLKTRVSICHKIRPYSSTQVKLAYNKKANVYCHSE